MFKKRFLFIWSVILVMGMTACSLERKDGTVPETIVEPETSEEEITATENIESKTIGTEPAVEKTETPETTVPENNGNKDSDTEEISEGDPIVGIVDKFSDNIIVIKDAGDPDLVYYFSTQNAQVVEGDSPIAVGDMVAISYRGVMGDEEHPGEAVKIVAESMMYQ